LTIERIEAQQWVQHKHDN